MNILSMIKNLVDISQTLLQDKKNMHVFTLLQYKFSKALKTGVISVISKFFESLVNHIWNSVRKEYFLSRELVTRLQMCLF